MSEKNDYIIEMHGIQKSFGGHNHTRSTITALNSPGFYETSLYNTQPVSSNAFYGQNLTVIGFDNRYHTALFQYAVNQNRTSSALSCIAALFCSNQMKLFSQKIRKSH